MAKKTGTVSIKQLQAAIRNIQGLLNQVQAALNKLDTTKSSRWNKGTPITIDPGPKTANIFGSNC